MNSGLDVAALRGLRGGRRGDGLSRIAAAHGPDLAARLASDVPQIDQSDVECAPFLPALWTGSTRHYEAMNVGWVEAELSVTELARPLEN